MLRAVDRHDPGLVAAYSERIAVERLAAGYGLEEVQAAFNALEEAVWGEAVAALDPADRLAAVEAVSVALREGRDALARAYVASAEGRRVEEDGPGAASGALTAREVRGSVGVLTFQDPKRRNALSSAMIEEVLGALAWFSARDVRAVVLRAGPDASVWSAGHDIAELPRGRRDPLAYNDPLEQCVRAIRSLPMPVIAMVHGSVWGGAFDLVLSCDVVVADETASFAITPANLGLPYNTAGLLHFLGRIPVNVVKEMFFSATPIEAEQAERWLVVNHLVPSAELESFTIHMAETMAAKAPLAIAAVKEQLRVLSDYQPVAAQVFERVQGLRREAYDSRDYLEGLEAFEQRRRPVFRGV